MSYTLITDPKNIFFRCVEDSNEAIMITDTKGTLLYVNPAWSLIYGYSKQEAEGQTPRILHSGYQTKEFYEQMWDSILNPEVGFWKGELVNRSKNGNMIPVLLSITPFRDGSNQIVGHMGIALDISQQKQLEAKVLQQDRLASIGILASGLAHEVGTPLGVVRGRAELLMMQAESLNASIGSGLKVIVDQIDRISKLINSLLRFSRSTDDVRVQEIDLMMVIQEVINLIGQNVRACSIDLKLDIPPNLKVVGDFNRLQQVFMNLMVNAMHAIQKAQAEETPRRHFIKISVESKDETTIIRIEDSGTGISAENLRKLFQPFFTTKDIGQGTGLGLAIVSKLIQEMNGEITVDSILGQGARFSIFLKKGFSS